MRGYIITVAGVLGMIFSILGEISASKKLEKQNTQISEQLDKIKK